jgi:glutathione S-transferase
VSSKGAVPVLVLESGERLTETAAVLQYIADLRPESGFAPPPGDPDRYHLQNVENFSVGRQRRGRLMCVVSRPFRWRVC